MAKYNVLVGENNDIFGTSSAMDHVDTETPSPFDVGELSLPPAVIDDRNGIAYYDFAPRSVAFDGNSVVILISPLGDTLDVRHQAMLFAIAHATDTTIRFISSSDLRVPRRERAAAAKGDLDYTARKIVHAVTGENQKGTSLRASHSPIIVGIGAGALLATHVSKVANNNAAFKSQSVALVEPPNMENVGVGGILSLASSQIALEHSGKLRLFMRWLDTLASPSQIALIRSLGANTLSTAIRDMAIVMKEGGSIIIAETNENPDASANDMHRLMASIPHIQHLGHVGILQTQEPVVHMPDALSHIIKALKQPELPSSHVS